MIAVVAILCFLVFSGLCGYLLWRYIQSSQAQTFAAWQRAIFVQEQAREENKEDRRIFLRYIDRLLRWNDSLTRELSNVSQSRAQEFVKNFEIMRIDLVKTIGDAAAETLGAVKGKLYVAEEKSTTGEPSVLDVGGGEDAK